MPSPASNTTLCTNTLISTTRRPVIFSIALFTAAWIFSQTSLILYPKRMLTEISIAASSVPTSTFTPLVKFFLPSISVMPSTMPPVKEATPSTSVTARDAMVATTSSAKMMRPPSASTLETSVLETSVLTFFSSDISTPPFLVTKNYIACSRFCKYAKLPPCYPRVNPLRRIDGNCSFSRVFRESSLPKATG
ncbi:hypothetical protein SDC9_158775 [bioreactor metagenome]|uniref:Uncharacterized protein n=1 Tax=bioreactor metagenome TaxID=1076179 RepID=A0A645FDE7_9ZZZZ